MNGLRRLMLDSLDRPVHHTDEGVENFNRWFEGSKAVDEQGRPLVVYHGTDADFNEFSSRMQGRTTGATSSRNGFFFASSPRTAQSYADYSATTSPIDRLVADANKAERRGNWDLYDQKIAEAEALEDSFRSPENRMRGQNLIPTYLSLKNPYVLDAAGENPEGIGGIDPILRRAMAAGHDGVIIRNFDDAANIANDSADHYVVFRPEQIKSATGNSGAYSPNTRDITGAATPAALAATAAAAGTGAALETQRRREAPEQNLLSWLADSAKARWERTIDDVREAASAAAEFGGEVVGGIKNVPYRTAGTLGDLAHLGLSATNPVPGFWGDPKDFPLTSDWMIERGVEAGLRDRPATNSLGEMVGEALPSLFNPANYGNAARRSIFAGQKAATADLAAMRRAEERLAGGDDPAKVWAEEGWFRGPDGQMRFEIDDSQAELRGIDTARFIQERTAAGVPIQQAVAEVRERERTIGPLELNYLSEREQPIGQVLRHDELFNAYPDAESVRFQTRRELPIGEGIYSPELDYIAIGRTAENGARSNMLHELQHSIDLREGNSPGFSPMQAQELIDSGVEPYASMARQGFSAHDIYEREAAEAMARAVQARLDLSAAERRARYPLEDYDVPLEELIIRR